MWELYQDLARCMVLIEVRLPSDDVSVGAGFHIGGGYIATAKHVVKDVTVLRILGGEREIVATDYLYHPDDSIDVAVIRTNFTLAHFMTMSTIMDPRREAGKTDFIPLGFHLTDWVGDEFILSKVLLMGYPPIPFSRDPALVAVQGEVNAIVDCRGEAQPYFIISPVARGGFSGGPVISEWGFLLGILSQEFFAQDARGLRPGFSAALTIEPLLEICALNNIDPPGFDDIRDSWSDFVADVRGCQRSP